MNKLQYRILDSEASISHNLQWIWAYQENIDTLKQLIKDKAIDIVQWEKGIKEMEEDRNLDIWFLELQNTFHKELLKKLNEIK